MRSLRLLVAALLLCLLGLLIRPGRASAAADPLRTAEHDGSFTGTSIDWHSRLMLGSAVVSGQRLPLVVPLSADVEVIGVHNADPLVEDGRLVALRVDDPRLTVVVDLRQPLDGGGADRLEPPLVESGALQRVGLDGVEYHPADTLGLEKRLRHYVVRELRAQGRRRVDRVLDGGLRPLSPHVYIVADQRVAAAGGLVGQVRPSGVVPGVVAGGVGAAFVVALLGGVAGHRLLERQARRERVHAWLETEFAAAAERSVDGVEDRSSRSHGPEVP